ncbi:hypothetical protein K6119_06160 [Paracrocinitomix mangrovi]|uniref:hypothetical protein n=1 Tax=Paracrocinitomix mangrovi TaxID=2862509 RepID=UPI001C8DA298|nr:hypothetical protein [Paracrocinitomix mangrovi]UKN03095.1 hypothetical protein K6119_06160 [Paracrocinitomix mangrovi]
MKTLIKNMLIVAMLIIAQSSIAQTALVGPINTFNVNAHPTTASKLVRMELVQREKFNVLDEYDMYEVQNPEQYDSCYSKLCLVEYGKVLNADLVISGSIDKIGRKIIITLKMIDVNSEEVKKTVSREFTDQQQELQRMIGIVVDQLLGIDSDPELVKRLEFKNEVITSTNVGRVNNSGPRMGVGFTHGNIAEFMTRGEDQGGLDMVPVMSNLGYQFEAQYVGTENFSALFEIIPSFNGLEQGKFMPNLALLNGFRFGQQGWEFAFGPSFGLKKISWGFFDTQGIYGEAGKYWRQGDLHPAGFDGSTSAIEENGYFVEEHLDDRGAIKFSTRWVMAFGRTFRSGALNIPVNLFYSSNRGGGMAGFSVGFNITRSKKSINR